MNRPLRRLALSLVLLAGMLGAFPTFAADNAVRLPDAHALQFYLRWTPGRTPLISAHRGGPMPGYPENCIETFKNALEYQPCLIECDVARTKDGTLVMMHDDTVDRTTTGTGLVDSLTFEEVRALRLIDNEGDTTNYQVPTFGEVLDWAKDNAILTVDMKPSVSPEEIVNAIHDHDAEGAALVITYTTEQAAKVHALDPNLVLSCTVRNQDEWNRLLQAGVTPPIVVAFVGVHEPDRSLYAFLHSQGVRTILGTMGNLDTKAEKRGEKVYVHLYRNGADILSTDRVPAVSEAVNVMEQQAKDNYR